MHRPLIILLLLLVNINLSAQKVDILYFTDAHRIFPVDDVEGGRGGVARLKTIVDESKSDNANTLVIHGGDLCGGVLFGGMYKGLPMIEAFNEIPVDICNFGQHEFDFGVDHTLELLSKSKSEWFSSNLKNRDGEPFGKLPKYLMKKIGGIKIAFIGLTDAMNSTMKSNRVIQEDLSIAISDIIEDLQNVDFLIAITQTDLETNRKLLEQFPDIDLVLTEEQYEYESNVFYKGNKPIVATAGNMSSVAKISLQKGERLLIEIIPLDENIVSEKYLRDMEIYYKRDMELKLAEKISYLEVPLNFRDGITKESAAGNLVSDAYREWYKSDVGLINGGGIRADIPKGDFTIKSARSLLPFGNKICQILIEGKELKSLLKKYAGNTKGQLLHVSGISYQYDQKTDSIHVEWKGDSLSDDELLTVSLNNYFLKKLDVDCDILINETDLKAKEDYEVLRQYCKKQKALHPKVQGRFVIVRE